MWQRFLPPQSLTACLGWFGRTRAEQERGSTEKDGRLGALHSSSLSLFYMTLKHYNLSNVWGHLPFLLWRDCLSFPPFPHTLNCPLEEGFACLTGSHAVVVPRSNVPTHQAQPLRDCIEHVFALGGWVLHDGAGAVIIPLTAGPTTNSCAIEHRWRV